MKVSVTFDLTPLDQQAIAHSMEWETVPDYDTCKLLIRNIVRADLLERQSAMLAHNADKAIAAHNESDD
jgi:hypothetical protein